MNFLKFNGLMLAACFPAAILFSIGVVVCMAPMGLLAKSGKPRKALALPLFLLAAAFQIYFWGLWSAFCVSVAVRFMQKPEVTWHWLYWVSAFGWCTGLLGWFWNQERAAAKIHGESAEDATKMDLGASVYGLVSIVAFLVFAFARSPMVSLYGWLLRPIGLA